MQSLTISLSAMLVSLPLVLRRLRKGQLPIAISDFSPGGSQAKTLSTEVVKTGIEVLSENNFLQLREGRVGVIANATSVLPDMTHLVDTLHKADNVNLVAIFGPEHGFRGTAQAGSAEGFQQDQKTQIPVYDIYLKKGQALASIFEKAEVDVLVFDIQDVGVRFYTYVWTLYDCMVAAAMASRPIRIVVADRPNPIGGVVVDGPLLKAEFSSFVGRKPIALRHGMTVGELALLFNSEYITADAGRQAELEVIPLKGWTRGMLQDDTKRLWVAPSPNMPTPTTALLYPGMCLFEGTNCSEGRGTTQPFELIGAPWIDYRLAQAANKESCPGALFREATFTPAFSKFSGKSVHGLQIHVSDSRVFNPMRVAVTLLVLIRKMYPKSFSWRCDKGRYWIDMLTGSKSLREGIDGGSSVDELMARWHDDIVWFSAIRHEFLLYSS